MRDDKKKRNEGLNVRARRSCQPCFANADHEIKKKKRIVFLEQKKCCGMGGT